MHTLLVWGWGWGGDARGADVIYFDRKLVEGRTVFFALVL